MDPAQIKVLIGPGIRPCCYVSEVTKNLKQDWSTYVSDGHINLLKFITDQLEEEGVRPENIYDIGLCTWCSRTEDGEYLFFSDLRSRRLGEAEGRFIAVSTLRAAPP